MSSNSQTIWTSSTVLTNNSVLVTGRYLNILLFYNQRIAVRLFSDCKIKTCLNQVGIGEWRWQPPKNFLIGAFDPISAVSVIEHADPWRKCNPDAHASEQWVTPGFHSCLGQYKLNHHNTQGIAAIHWQMQWISLRAAVTFYSYTSWIVRAKTTWKMVHCKVHFIHVFWPNSI